MKCSKSIFIFKGIFTFVFVLGSSVTFCYQLKRTDGNIRESIRFTRLTRFTRLSMYLLALEFRLIGPNVGMALNQHKSNQQIHNQTKIKVLPHYQDSYYRASPLYMTQTEMRPLGYQYSHSAKSISELRAGALEGEFTMAMIIWLLEQFQESTGFQQPLPVRRPHNEAADNIGKPKADGYFRPRSSAHASSSSDELPTHSYMQNFIDKDGKVNQQKIYNEMRRQASIIGNKDFYCPPDRFESLGTECGKCTKESVKEAMSVLLGEMQGLYKNSRRTDYGPNVTGPDFVVEGIGKLSNVTHVEVKNPVSSSIQKKVSLRKQSKEIARKLYWQKEFWTNKTDVKERIPHIKPDAILPKSPKNFVGVCDLRDVGTSEKSIVRNTILDVLNELGDEPRTIFLNHNKNI